MRARSTIAALLVSAHLAGCVALGWRFGPGRSCTDRTLFAEPPVVVHRAQGYFLTWTQGSHPYEFLPTYQAQNGQLVFALVAMSSSGNAAGKPHEIRIEGDENITALVRGGAIWWEAEPEPDGRRVPLKVLERPAAPDRESSSTK